MVMQAGVLLDQSNAMTQSEQLAQQMASATNHTKKKDNFLHKEQKDLVHRRFLLIITDTQRSLFNSFQPSNK